MWKTTGPGLGGLWVGKAIEVSSGWEAVGALGSYQGYSMGGRYWRKLFLEPGRGREPWEPCFI